MLNITLFSIKNHIKDVLRKLWLENKLYLEWSYRYNNYYMNIRIPLGYVDDIMKLIEPFELKMPDTQERITIKLSNSFNGKRASSKHKCYFYTIWVKGDTRRMDKRYRDNMLYDDVEYMDTMQHYYDKTYERFTQEDAMEAEADEIRSMDEQTDPQDPYFLDK